MDTYEFLERVNSNMIAELDIQDYVEVKTSNNLDKLKTFLSDLDNFQKNRISEIVIDSYFKNKNDSKLPQKPLDDLRQYLETKIKSQLQSQNKINSIPDVSVFSHSINNTVFDKVLLKTFEDNRANRGYYKNVFDNWANTRINSLKNSSLMERSKLLEGFLNSFCKQLIDNTIRIATGAHYYFKGDTKYNKYYTTGYINLFHLLNYGNDGRLNTIEIYLERLRLFREKNPFLALQFQDYCVDRIKELKNMLEMNFFFKKSNPIFFHYDLIIDEFNNCINIEKERIKLELSKNNGLIGNGDHSKQVLKPKMKKKGFEDFFYNISNKPIFFEELKATFITERGIPFGILLDELKKCDVLKIGNSEFANFHECAKSFFNHDIGSRVGIINYKPENSENYKEEIDIISTNLKPLIIKFKTN